MEELKCAYDSSESGSDREESPTEPAEKRAKGELRCNKEAANVTHSGNSKCQRPIQEQQGKLGAVGSGGIEHSNRFSVPPSSAEGHVAGGGIFRPVGRSYHSAAQWGAGERTQPRKELPAPSTAATRSSEAPKSEHCDSKIRRYIPKRLREKAASSHGSAVTGPVRVGDLGITEETRNAEQSRTEQLSPVSNVPSRANRPPKKVLVRFSGHTKGVNCVRWCPQKANLLLSASMDHSIHLWDIHSRQSVEKLECHGGSVKAAQWSHCGTKVLSCGYDKMARITNIQTGQELAKFSHEDYATCVQFHPSNHNLFMVGTFKSNIFCWDTRSAKVASVYSAFFGQVQDLAFLPGAEAFVSAAEVVRRNSTDKGIMVWDFRSTAILSNQIYQEAFTCTCLRVHPSEMHFIAQSSGDYMAIFSTKRPYKLNKLKRYEGHKVAGYHIGCDISPDGSIIASGSSDGNLYFFNQHSSRIIKTIPGHSMACMDVSCHPSLPSTVASAGWDGTVAVWE